MAIGDSKKLRNNKNRKRSKEQHDSEVMKNSNPVQKEEIFPVGKEERKMKSKKVKVELKRSKHEADISDLSNSKDQIETYGRGKKNKRLLKNRKMENYESSEKETGIFDQPNEIEDGFGQEDSEANEIEENSGKSRRKKRKSVKKADEDGDADEVEESQKGKSRRKKRKSEKKAEADSDANEVKENPKGKSRKKRKSEKKTEIDGVARPYTDAENMPEQENVGKSRKTEENFPQPNAKENFLGNSGEDEEVYELSSGDENASKGMRKWITQYYQSRLGLQILQEKIDEYMVAYEAEKEQERKEKESRIAEDGWTVVVHHKGRKKTTDSETGIAVGSVSQAAVIDNIARKKIKETGLDFYRFQKREAKRNEIMELQSKFEQDKKRAQQLRAARKFRPL